MSQKIGVAGMTCGNCARHVKDALLEIDGVQSADVDLNSNSATVRATRTIPSDEFARVLDEAGYALT